jgi:hypothetical protein
MALLLFSKSLALLTIGFVIFKIGIEVDFSKIKELHVSSGNSAITVKLLAQIGDNLTLAGKISNNLAVQNKTFSTTTMPNLKAQYGSEKTIQAVDKSLQHISTQNDKQLNELITNIQQTQEMVKKLKEETKQNDQ